ncbi:MAG: hypothetical protein ACNS63_07435 [Candidatus Nitrospinota bacterium M3_3B_026]
MSFLEVLKDTLRAAWRQTSHFIEIMRLKLRIIGFSNKRNGLLTKLGEAVYRNIAEGKPAWEDEKVKRLVEETRSAGDEISKAEEAIDQRKAEARREREEYRQKLRSARREKAAASSAGASGASSFQKPAGGEGKKADEAAAGGEPSPRSGGESGRGDDDKPRGEE